ncbi:hypothetical protein SNE40_015338 [Patella caerulea]|uniref:VWFA domain-containing protein n=1 Tax=Patella caerulea TaxID=87958 RepID=A0AAN8JJR2_PATCE
MAGITEQPTLPKHDSTVLDLAFAMDCTGSMSSYIYTAQTNIRNIVEQIVASEKSDIRLALVEYRDHPPQEITFVTRTHDFTSSVQDMKRWLDKCSAHGGGDRPEAVADALHDVLRLCWRPNATKICVLVSDAPPHGLGDFSDTFPNGCPNNLDPMTIVRSMAEKGIILYTVGCEPSITPYKEFFAALAYLTGGQYVPLMGAKALTQVIIGGAQEEISLERWMEDVNVEVERAVEEASDGDINVEAVTRRVWGALKGRGARGKQLLRNRSALSGPSKEAKKLSTYANVADVRKDFKESSVSRTFRGRGSARKTRGGRGGGKGCPRSRSRSRSPTKRSSPESFTTEESEIQIEQAARMVQKSLMRKRAIIDRSSKK